MLSLTREQSRRVDQLAIEQLGIPSLVLMENAGANAARAIIALLSEGRALSPIAARVGIVCGGGNNGGDGYVIARHLHNAGARVTLYPAVDPGSLKGDAFVNADIALRMGLALDMVCTGEELDEHAARWQEHHIIVDALLGTGFVGRVRPHHAAVIAAINAAGKGGAHVVAIDLPSGLDCDTGQPSNATVRADVTITFVAPKIGFAAPGASGFTGRVVVAEIGVPPSLIEHARQS